jgi:L-malate glycosyltransferase
MKSHILYVIDSLVRLAGAERNLLNICRLLPKDKYRCSVVVLKANTRAEDLKQFPCDMHTWPLDKTYDWNAVKVAFKLRRFIRSEHVDVVHTFFQTADIWAAPIARLSGCPLVISSRRDMGILRSRRHHLAYRFVNPLFSRILAVSDAVRNVSLRDGGVDPANVTILRNGVDIQAVKAAEPADRGELDLTEASHLIATVGFIRKVKGFDVFIRTADLVRRKFPSAVFLIIGGVIGGTEEQNYYEELRQLTESLDLTTNVRFVGISNDVLRILKVCNVFALLSRSEGLPNALLEAMACGIPCVATAVGGTPEVLAVPGCGYLVPPEDANAAADHILTLLRDGERAKLVGQAGLQRVANTFAAESMVAKLQSIYDDLLRNRIPTVAPPTSQI